MLGVVALLACSAETEKKPLPVTWRPPKVAERYEHLDAAAEGVAIDIAYSSIGKLHRGYFENAELTGALSVAAKACVDDTLDMVITYDEVERTGRVVVSMLHDRLKCRATPVDTGLDVSALLPLTTALAAYRNAVAAKKDIRIYGFRTGVHVRDGAGTSTLWIEGQDPIDGTTVSPCVEVDGFESCAPGKRLDGVTVVKLPKPERQARLTTLFGPLPPATPTPTQPAPAEPTPTE